MKKLVVTFATLVVAVGAYAKWGGIGGIAAKEALSLAVKVATDSTKTDESDKNSPTATGAGNSTTVAVPEQVTTSQENLGQSKQTEQGAVTTTQKNEEPEKKSETAANDPQEIVKIEDDNKFLELLKDAWNTAFNGNGSDDVCIALAYRASEVKDQKRLAEYLRDRDNASLALFVALARRYWHVRDPDWLKDPELAEVFIDNLGLSLQDYKTPMSLGDDLFGAVARLDAKGREKYLKNARENLEKAKKDPDIVVFEKYYVGMPIMDCIMFSLEDQLDWVKCSDPNRFFEQQWASEDEDFGKWEDWKSEWKVRQLVFVAKDRQRCFKVKGTLKGLLTFIKKYIDKSAELGDITINDGWWLYRDDEHERKIYLNDKTGLLNIK